MTQKYAENCVFIESKDTKQAYRINWQDLYDSFKKNYQLNSNYEISFTLTRAKGYEKVFDTAQAKCGVMYNGQWYNIQQREPKLDEQGFLTMQVTCTHTLIDMLKNVRIDPQEPTEQNPDVGGNNSSSDDSSNNDNPQPGTVIKRTAEQQLTTLDACMHKFVDNNNQGVKYELHGNFPQVAIECTGSLYEWLNSNLKTFSAYWIPDGYTVKIYDLASLRHQTGRQLRYMYNTSSVDIQEDDNNIVNDCWVYGGKVEADTTTVSGGGNGITEPQNGDWTPVIKNAASLTGQQLSDGDIALVKAQINLESSGQEDAKGGDDGLSDGIAMGLLQFKQATFNYYCRPPYTNIWHGLDQLIALFNVPNWRNQITGHSGWSPHGAPVSKAQITALSATSTGRSQQIIDYCKSFVGKVPYVWGGSSPSGWDCSGFVCYVLNHFGINTLELIRSVLKVKVRLLIHLIKQAIYFSGVLMVEPLMYQLQWIVLGVSVLITTKMGQFIGQLQVGHRHLACVFLALQTVMLTVAVVMIQQLPPLVLVIIRWFIITKIKNRLRNMAYIVMLQLRWIVSMT